MAHYTYAVVHNGIGDFLIFSKNNKGYFFHRRGGGGSIIVDGKVLNGAGDYAFPGGKPDDQGDVIDGAIEEMRDETRINLAGYRNEPDWYYEDTADGEYYGVYFNVGNDLDDIAAEALAYLRAGEQAAQAVIDGHYVAGQYGELMDAFPDSPADNELARFVASWNLFDQWDEIEALNAPPTDWFYNIIINLYEELFPARIYDAHDNIIGIAHEMILSAGNLYTTNCILYDPASLLQNGVYRVTQGEEEFARMGLRYLGGQQGVAEFRLL